MEEIVVDRRGVEKRRRRRDDQNGSHLIALWAFLPCIFLLVAHSTFMTPLLTKGAIVECVCCA